ncbi:MAG: hypothetical protein ABR886_11340 [Dehalococcoidales bacterium]|jgi:hypothetical protein
MAKFKYEKYVTRKPAIIRPGDYEEEIPKGDKVPLRTPFDTGPLVIFSQTLMPEANSIIEYGIVSGDMVIGDGSFVNKHKHDYEEIFLFLGTDPKDPQDLGAEVEFWIGEGKDMEKIVFTTSSSIWVPPNTAHFPQIWRNVKRPVFTVVVMPTTGKKALKPAARDAEKPR